MDCEVVHVESRSDEWRSLRHGRITASRLGDVMARKDTKRYRRYQTQIVLENAGAVFADKNEPWFEHGRDMEPRAIDAARYKFGWEIRTDIFLIHHKYDWLGCSPDGMINDMREGVEFKCRKVYQEYIKVREKGLEASHRFQVQAAMWLTGLDSWWYLNYYEHRTDGTRKLSRILVPRDDQLIAKMEARCLEFMDEVNDMGGLK